MQIHCPQCHKLTEYGASNPFRPFCSERCRQIDLGAWASDEYRVPGAPGSAASLSPADLESAASQALYLAQKAQGKKP